MGAAEWGLLLALGVRWGGSFLLPEDGPRGLAESRIASGLAAILNAGAPLFTAVLAHYLTRDERLTARAYVVYFRILATAGATNLLLVTVLIPAIALLLGTIVLDERLALRHLGGWR
jgi:drug/metabolite transporter (DMT)-like permease